MNTRGMAFSVESSFSLWSDSSSLYDKKVNYFKTDLNFVTIHVRDSSENVVGENSDGIKSTR